MQSWRCLTTDSFQKTQCPVTGNVVPLQTWRCLRTLFFSDSATSHNRFPSESAARNRNKCGSDTESAMPSNTLFIEPVMTHNSFPSEIANISHKKWGPTPNQQRNYSRYVAPSQGFDLQGFWSHIRNCLRFPEISMTSAVTFQQDVISFIALRSVAQTHVAVARLSKAPWWGPRYSRKCRNLYQVTKMWCHSSTFPWRYD